MAAVNDQALRHEDALVRGELPPVINRYELKYTIPPAMVEPISDFVSAYCALDKYSEMSHDKYYEVNSLYLDTPSFYFLRQRLGRARKRFNMRVRFYGIQAHPPYFLEIKSKDDDIINKYRARVEGDDWDNQHVIPCTAFIKGGDPREAENRDLFWKTVHTFNASPKVRIRYRRKAYVSQCDQYARVTFDTDLCYLPADNYHITGTDPVLVSCDHAAAFDPGCSVILELKCYSSYVPLWMLDLIRAFNLRKRGFSKYSLGLKGVFSRYGYDSAVLRSAVV